ncbi:MAG TPA: hypothetical protein PKU88_06280 [Bacillota bacterium]|nr:hypothetical protein [Bacillota bacterium]HNT03731.1 hypothetical protein [Bacillota bacterium]HPW41786.1 hypothetical protein [Bacillota bacterium]HPX68929.1 hypothetical protein [Bacillota bacterium]HQA65896.1 hypothetical protein [Bacillota bacterium]
MLHYYTQDICFQCKALERGVAVTTAIDSNAVVEQTDKYHAAIRCCKVLVLEELKCMI